MKTTTSTTTTKVIYEDNNGSSHRFIWERVWDNTKPKVAILMIFPSSTDPLKQDLTSILVINNVSKLEGGKYGGVVVWNLFSKVNYNSNDTEPNLPANDTCIAESAKDPAVEKIIIAFGKGGESSKKILKRQMEVLQLLEPHKSKVVEILSPCGKTGFHPLTPAIKNHWELVVFKFPDFKKIQKEQEAKDNNKKKKGKGNRKGNAADEAQPVTPTTPDPQAEAPPEDTPQEQTT